MCKFGGDRAICLREEAICEKFTDGRTDDGRRTIALAHSWNELKTGNYQTTRPIYTCVISDIHILVILQLLL